MSLKKSTLYSRPLSQLPLELSNVQYTCILHHPAVAVTLPQSRTWLMTEGFTDTKGVITTTMFDVPGYRISKVFSTVNGITVRRATGPLDWG
ncbi:hypothetical protein CNMCM8927_003506 [Aspergillus lentulus]|uniref:Uncharacterized protein n=1 Tax=Aspergillus lentulus TaxID=293939 RepID=A0AAN5YGX8_ASPLE|nr:hypothetical protein CNMCM8927_003506 [Aspergillus lentulus]